MFILYSFHFVQWYYWRYIWNVILFALKDILVTDMDGVVRGMFFGGK